MSKKHKLEKVKAGKYIYRGLHINLNPSESTGYWGRWTAPFHCTSDSLKSVQVKIDRYFDEP